MKESKFVGQNKEIWQKFETDLRIGQNKSRLSNLFTQVTDDLSYARTFYKFRSVKVYLNGIAQILFNTIYRNQSGTMASFWHFWKVDLPLEVHEARKEFRVSLLLFLIAFTIGIVSSIYDKDFARSILGNDYVNMTVENIKNHDPMAVYKKGNEATMFLGITINNLYVSLITFLLGAFMAVGTILALIRNGVMVGVFQYFFIERGLFKESFLTIWQHGTIEISCIIIAGAAGLTLGRGLLFPGTYSRMQAFKISARRGLKIFTGIAPLIMLAGFIESFITRHTDVNIIVRIAVICSSLGFILFYFGWYPWFIYHRNSKAEPSKEKIYYKEGWKYDFNKILTANETFGYSLKFFNQNVVFFIFVVLGASLFHAIITLLYEIQNVIFSTYIRHNLESFFVMNSLGVHFWVGIFTIGLCLVFLAVRLNKLLGKTHQKNISFKKCDIWYLCLSSFIASFLLLVPFSFGYGWGIASLIILGPLLFFAVYTGFIENKILPGAIGETISLLSKSWTKLMWNSLKIGGFIMMLYLLINSYIGWQIIEGVYLNFNLSSESWKIVEMVMLTFTTVILFSIYFFFQIITAIFSYYSFRETLYAENLNERIDMLGERTILFGFEKEK